MNRSHWLSSHVGRALLALAGLVVSLAAVPALADPPDRAVRLSYLSGNVSFAPAGSEQWVQGRINRPLWIGDRLWSADGQVELQLGGASLRMAPRTALTILNFDNRLAQFEVTEGSVALHVRVLDRDDTIEIDTPSFAFVTQERGDYRIDVDEDRTAVTVRNGFADVYGADLAYRIDRREQYIFYGTDLRDYDVLRVSGTDPFDRWVRERIVREERSVSARYVAPELVGYADLDQYGDWRNDATYGSIWVPRVRADWAPYRYGHWAWIDPWGWTWIDDSPWGYAPFHYGRWAMIGSSWAWVPGPRTVRPVYSPALVAWVGGPSFSLTIGSGQRGAAWFPLAPGEVWAPWYDSSREYFTRVNVANTVVNQTTVVNVYNSVQNNVTIQNVQYRHRSTPAAITAVPVETVISSRPVQTNIVRVQNNIVAQAPIAVAPAAQPVAQSYIGAGAPSQAKPPAETLRRQVVARTAPAAASASLEDKANLVKQRGNKPIDRQTLERSAQAAAPEKPAAGQPPAAAGAQQGASRAAPPAAAAPSQLRPNVRVVDAQKTQPKPAPSAPAEDSPRAEKRKAERAARVQQDDSPAATPGTSKPAATAERGAPKAPGAAEPSAPKGPATVQPGAPKPPTTAEPGTGAKPPTTAQPGAPAGATPPAAATVPGDTRAGRAPAEPRTADAAGPVKATPSEGTGRSEERKGRDAAPPRAAEAAPRTPDAMPPRSSPIEAPGRPEERRGRDASSTRPGAPAPDAEAAGPGKAPRQDSARDARGRDAVTRPDAGATAAEPRSAGAPGRPSSGDGPETRGRNSAGRPEPGPPSAATAAPPAARNSGGAAKPEPRGRDDERARAAPTAPQAAAPGGPSTKPPAADQKDARAAPGGGRPSVEDTRRATPAAGAAPPIATPAPPLPPAKADERPAPKGDKGRGRKDADDEKDKDPRAAKG